MPTDHTNQCSQRQWGDSASESDVSPSPSVWLPGSGGSGSDYRAPEDGRGDEGCVLLYGYLGCVPNMYNIHPHIGRKSGVYGGYSPQRFRANFILPYRNAVHLH